MPDAWGPVLVIGGTRGTGRLIVERLVGRGEHVRILARDPARAPRPGGLVAVVEGDITKIESLPAAVAGARHIIFTAGVRSGRPSGERQIKTTEYDGVVNVLGTARDAGFQGRFLYMTASGAGSHSLAAKLLNLYKGNTLVWRRRAEDAIRQSGLEYTIIRAGVLLNAAGGRHAIEVTQRDLALSPRHRIARADVADGFVAAMDHPKASRVTFDVAWGKGRERRPWGEMLDRLSPDAGRES